MAEVKTKVVVITGCSSGIGLSTAVLMAKQDGYKVIATMRNLQKKTALEKAAGETLNKTLFIRELDVSKEESIVGFIKDTYKREERIDILVSNAGILQCGAFEFVTREEMENMMQTNFFGPVRLTQEVVHDMKKRRAGKIIYVSSILGVTVVPAYEYYNASKHALEAFVGSIAPIMRHFNISVTSLQPGPVYTDLFENVKVNSMGAGCLSDDVYTRDPRADDETNDCIQKIFDGAEFKKSCQTSEEVAIVIKEWIEDDHPQVKIQSNIAMTKFVGAAVVDPSGKKTFDEFFTLLK